ncbi:hypothetical protein D3C76_48000 [compost metagenome]
MKIESIIRRKNGTRVELDDSVYHFKPSDTDERHLCDVTIKAHVQRFLSITEGYQPAELSEEQKVAPLPVHVEEVQPVVTPAAVPAPESVAEQGSTTATDLADDDEKESDAPAELDRDSLAAEYEQKMGRKPHHKLSAERIKQILDENEAE